MQRISVFTYPTRAKATVITGEERTYNMNMQNDTIKVHRGAGQVLEFVVQDADTKPIKLDEGKHLELVVINRTTKKHLFSRRLEKLDTLSQASTGNAVTPSVRKNSMREAIYRCDVTEADIRHAEPGTQYIWSIVIISNEELVLDPTTQRMRVAQKSEYLYTNRGHNVSGTFMISTEAQPAMTPTIEVHEEDFRSNDLYIDPNIEPGGGYDKDDLIARWSRYISFAIPGDAYDGGSADGLHTVAFYLENFTGHVQLQGTLNNTVPIDDSINGEKDWFLIPALGEGTVNERYDNFTGIVTMNYVGQFRFLRVVYYTPKIHKDTIAAAKERGYDLREDRIKKVLIRC